VLTLSQEKQRTGMIIFFCWWACDGCVGVSLVLCSGRYIWKVGLVFFELRYWVLRKGVSVGC
jgi:hypothetical protein